MTQGPFSRTWGIPFGAASSCPTPCRRASPGDPWSWAWHDIQYNNPRLIPRARSTWVIHGAMGLGFPGSAASVSIARDETGSSRRARPRPRETCPDRDRGRSPDTLPEMAWRADAVGDVPQPRGCFLFYIFSRPLARLTGPLPAVTLYDRVPGHAPGGPTRTFKYTHWGSPPRPWASYPPGGPSRAPSS